MKNNSPKIYISLKMLALVISSTLVLCVKPWPVMLSIFILVTGCTLVCNFLKPDKNYYRIFRSLIVVGFMIVVFNLILNSTSGYLARLLHGAIAAEKILSLGLLVFAFTATTSVNNIISVFAFLPQRVQLVLTITFGLIPALIEETHKIILVQSARGVKLRGVNFVKNIFPIIIPLLHRSFQRAEHLAILLCVRGYEV